MRAHVGFKRGARPLVVADIHNIPMDRRVWTVDAVEKADPDVQPKVGALYIREWAWKLQELEPPKRVRVTVEQA